MSNNDEIIELRNEIRKLRQTLQDKETKLDLLLQQSAIKDSGALANDEIARYSRQIIIPGFGVNGQLKLKNSSVLVVGAGGLGCPSSLYLVGAGVGTIGILDYDEIEITNLHRQLLHSEHNIGISKVDSAIGTLRKLNSNIHYIPHKLQLDSSNAIDIIKSYDVVVDATDNVATRYLLNDACIMTGRPLVAGSALQMEGQLTVYGYKNGPCYRCLFPVPPPPETVTNCGDGGVLGAVPGVIGVLQAIEVIKIILDNSSMSGHLLLYDATTTSFRNIKLRGKSPTCSICSENRTITKLIDYEQFCGSKATDKDPKLKILQENERISSVDFSAFKGKYVLIDVRSPAEFEMCQLKNAINIPIKDILHNKQSDSIKEILNRDVDAVYVVCRRGNDSQKAVRHLKETFSDIKIPIFDVIGGLHAWTANVDKDFPLY